jgi:hypothetical protein
VDRRRLEYGLAVIRKVAIPTRDEYRENTVKALSYNDFVAHKEELINGRIRHTQA